MDFVQRQKPKSWTAVTLDEVCEPDTGTRDPRSKPDEFFSYVDITSVDSQLKRIVGSKTLRGKDAPSRARKVIRAGDVIVATTRPNLNAVAVVPPELDDQICSTGFCVLRTKKDLCPAYLFAFTQSKAFVSSVSNLVKGALYPAITDKQVRSQKVLLPSLGEQKRIAAIFASQIESIAQARSALREQVESTKALLAAYTNNVFLTPEAQKWPRKSLREICLDNGQYGTSQSSTGSGLPVLRMGNLIGGRISWENLKYIQLPAHEEKKYLLSKGDVLFNRTNSAELVGKTAVFEGERDAVFASYLIRFRLREEVALPRFVSAYINSKFGREFIEANMARAIGQVNINASTMHKMSIPIPPVDEQERIVRVITRQTDSAQRLLIALAQQLDTVDKLPRALLSRAFQENVKHAK